MQLEVEERYDEQGPLEPAGRWVKNPMETIHEVDEDSDSVKDSDEIKRSSRAQLMDISSRRHGFIYPLVGDHSHPGRIQVSHEDGEANAQVALIQQQLTYDVTRLRDFLRGRLFDQYCLMRCTTKKEKDPTWLEYGKCIISGKDSEYEKSNEERHC